ncbi:MAG: type IV pilus assembly protein PilC [Candidatus Azotimanducaceae bacterium]|jgi:type IV pilus assembly protein PilC
MAKFTYQGTTQEGEEVTKTVEAADRFAVYEVARKDGHTVTTINKSSGFSIASILNIKKIEYAISRVSSDDLVMVTRNLGSMITAGLPLLRALSVIERQSSNPRLRGILEKVRERINKGEQFNEALAQYPKTFSDLYVAMVRAGEESGMLSDSLAVLGKQLERSSNLKKKIKGAMIYPAIVITILFIIGILMMIYVMPSITGTFKNLDTELPATTQILIAVSDFLIEHTVLAFGGIIGSIVGFIYFLKTKIGKKIFSWVIVRLPVIGTLAKEANSASSARTLSSLLSSGVDVIRSINITEQVVQNVYYKRILADAAKRVEKGTALSDVFIERTDLYPILVGEMIVVGEETGQISQMLEQLATFYENEVEQKTKDLSTIIEPVLMVVIGVIVGFFALAVIAPIYSIGDSI